MFFTRFFCLSSPDCLPRHRVPLIAYEVCASQTQPKITTETSSPVWYLSAGSPKRAWYHPFFSLTASLTAGGGLRPQHQSAPLRLNVLHLPRDMVEVLPGVRVEASSGGRLCQALPVDPHRMSVPAGPDRHLPTIGQLTTRW